MKHIFYLILGILLVILTSATTASIITVKPATPKQVIVKDFWGAYGIEKEMQKYITLQIKSGFIVKGFTLDSEENGYQRGLLVMEKY